MYSHTPLDLPRYTLLLRSTSQDIYAYLGYMDTLLKFVDNGDIFCESDVRLEMDGMMLLELSSPLAWPLSPRNDDICRSRPVPGV